MSNTDDMADFERRLMEDVKADLAKLEPKPKPAGSRSPRHNHKNGGRVLDEAFAPAPKAATESDKPPPDEAGDPGADFEARNEAPQQNGHDREPPPADHPDEHDDDDDVSMDRPPTFSDEALALSFAELHADDLRYVAAWSRWMIWDGTRWRFDETMEAYSMVRKVCRAAAADCNKAKLASALASAKTVAAVASLARSDRRLAATTGQWDTDLWLLNTPGGVVDLRTGKRRPARPTDYMTKITTAIPDGNAATTVWLAFLKRITGDNSEFIAFMQRIAGYALTGSTREEALFFLYGIGANGKSTFLNAITGIIGDYHTVAPIETFTASMQEHHPTDLAGLRGARLVTSVETEEGRRWAEAKIKALTGGDKISARFMRQDNFEYVPTFKLMIAGNHKPGLRSVDEAIRRRFHLLPFDVTIPLQERDAHLGDRLRQEWPGILQWMIEGCVAWQKRGLEPPATVRAATSAYLEAEDAFAAWLDETGVRDPNAWESTKTLFASWKAWAEQTGENAGTMKRFVQNMDTRGITLERRNYARGLRGFRIGLNLDGGP
jgi:putative DNA primase/helicase